MRKLALLLTLLTGLVAGAVVWRGVAAADGADATVLGDLISKALSTPGSRVQVGAVDGALSSDATIRDIVISDKDGPWLKLDRARLIWRRMALLSGRLEVDALEIGVIEIIRRPAPSDEPAPASDGPLLPELPVKIEIKKFELSNLVLGQAVAGEAARVSAKGSAKLGDPAEGLDLNFEGRRLDREGRVEARLVFVPKTEKLSVTVAVKEPEGGLVSRLSNLPGAPPIDLDVRGEGALDLFNAKVQLVAGETVGANGEIIARRHPDGRRVTIDLSTRLTGLLPAPLQPIFAGGALWGGTLVFKNDGAMGFDYLRVESDVARFDIGGEIDKNKIVDVSVSARALKPQTNAARPDVTIDKFMFDATMKGPADALRVAAALDLARAKTPQGALGRAAARFDVVPGASPKSFDLTGEAEMSGLALADPAMAKALGDAATLRLAARVDPDGRASVSVLTLTAKALTASFSGVLAARRVDGRLELSAPDLSRFAGVSGAALRGAAKASFDISGDPAGRLDAKASAGAENFAVGLAPLDRLIGARPTLEGGLFSLPRGGFGVDGFRLKGAHLTARADGRATRVQSLIELSAAIDDLRQFDGRMTGTAELSGKLTGSLEDPAVSLRVSAPNATALKRPLRELTLAAEARNLATAPAASATLSGEVSGKPAKGAARLTKGGDRWRVDDLDVAVGSVTARGAFAVSAKGVDGALSLKAGELDDVSALTLTPLSGDLDAALTFTSEAGQTAAAKIQSRRLRVDDVSVERLVADLTARDLATRPIVVGVASLARAARGAQELASNLKLESRADGQVALSGRAQGFDLSAAGRLVQSDEAARLDLARFEARKGAERVALAEPGSIVFGSGGTTLRHVALLLDGGRLDLDGRVSPTLDLAVRARAVPLSVANLAKPGLGLSGVLDAEARVSGQASAPHGDWRLSVRDFSAPALSGAGVGALRIDASGRLSEGRASLEASAQSPRLGPIKAVGSIPIDGDGALDLRVTGKLDLALANARLGADGRRLAGFADVDVRVAGSTDRPQLQGGATLAGASFSDAETGLKLENIRGRVVGGADELRLEGVTGTTANGGAISAQGRVGLSNGMPAAIKITASNAQLMNSPIATAVADLNLDVSGPLASGPLVAGRIGFSRLDVTIPERLPASSRPLDKVKHVAPPPQVRKRLAQQAKAKKAASSGADARLDLKISAPNRVFVRGRGVDAELGGDLTVKGPASRPSVIGGFGLRRGQMAIGGRRLQFTRAKLVFSGGLQPEIDFLAQNQASDAIVYVGLTGSAAEPDFKFYSEPDLPQDEVLARLIFGKSSGGLTTAQAIQLAMIAAQFSGGGDGAFEKMRRQLGVDSLDVGVGADGGVGVGVNKAINDRISIGAKAGAKPADTGVSVDVDLSRRLRVQGEATADGNTGVGLGFELEY